MQPYFADKSQKYAYTHYAGSEYNMGNRHF